MEELKQRLSHTQVSSNFDVDRIVKETKTTTITESRETIHFKCSKPHYQKSVNTLTGGPSIKLSDKSKVDASTRPDVLKCGTTNQGPNLLKNPYDMKNYVNVDNKETKVERRPSIDAKQKYFLSDQKRMDEVQKESRLPLHIGQWQSSNSNISVHRSYC